MNNRRLCPWSLVGAVFYAFCTVIGAHFASFGKDIGGFGDIVNMTKYIPVFIILTGIYYCILRFFLNRKYYKRPKKNYGNIYAFYDNHIYVISFCILFVAWLPYLVVFFPGSVCNDGYHQLNQSMGITPLKNHHPILSTFMVGFFFRIGNVINNNAGVFLYVFFQMIVTAVIYAMSIKQIRKLKMNLKVCLASTFYFALVPVWGAYMQVLIKDTLYTAIFVWFVIWAISFADETLDKEKVIQKKTIIYFGISSFLLCGLRQNGKYIVFPVLACLIIVSLKKRKHIFVLFLVLSIIVGGYSRIIVPATGAVPASKREMFSILFQQTAKYLLTYPEDVTEEEYETINKVLGADTIAEVYNPCLSDPVKNTFKKGVSGNDINEYIQVWFEMFWKHPGVYMEAFFQHCYGYLDPFHLCTPVPVFQNYIMGSPTATGDFDINYTQGRSFRQIVTDYEMLWMEIFPLTLLTYPGVYTWLIVFCVLLLCKKRKWKQLTVLLIPLLVILINIASPVNGCLRYTLPLMAVMPLIVSWTVKEARISDKGRV